MRYTLELLIETVKSSNSIAEVMRKLSLAPAGGTHNHLTKRIKKFGIDTSHFTGIRTNSGSGHKGGTQKRTWQEVLVVRDKTWRKESTHRLRRALIESGRPHICNECGLGPVWNNKPLCLQVEHIDANFWNCVASNLTFLCPNCHTQTSTYGKIKTHNKRICKKCDRRVSDHNKSGICWWCKTNRNRH